ncbi:MAG: glutamate-5-semialdehyde dehydrogenase [Deltaproteobacteria bacterium]|nr:glutamate-5-semialdehyde dehydrogenase [Deltaproteobacteria bacterium]
MKKKIQNMAVRAREASSVVATLSTEIKNRLLSDMADRLVAAEKKIIEANKKDLRFAEKKRLGAAFVDRLLLNTKRINEMASGLREVVALPDPVGQVVKQWTRPNGLKISRVRIPLGVIAVVYESRPNVTVDAAGLCLKSGNAIILRGGSESIHSNIALAKILRETLQAHRLDTNIIQIVDTPDRKAMEILVEQDKMIDLVIPRGGESLMKWMGDHSRIPVIKHDKGVCHIFVDKTARLDLAARVAFNAKVQRSGVCNAMETLLVHKKIAPSFLPNMIKKYAAAGVEIRGCPITRKIVKGVKAATEKDWSTEYLNLILSIRVVLDLESAIAHIRKYGSNHTESIITEDPRSAETFLNSVHSSVVLQNASTRFNDGGQLGLGAEIGISTTKLHAFGPMGLEELTTTKFIVKGDGQIRE